MISCRRHDGYTRNEEMRYYLMLMRFPERVITVGHAFADVKPFSAAAARDDDRFQAFATAQARPHCRCAAVTIAYIPRINCAASRRLPAVGIPHRARADGHFVSGMGGARHDTSASMPKTTHFRLAAGQLAFAGRLHHWRAARVRLDQCVGSRSRKARAQRRSHVPALVIPADIVIFFETMRRAF